MGFEDEVEQPIGRPCRQTNGRSKRPNELTSSIVPRGTSFHYAVELELPSIAFDLVRPSSADSEEKHEPVSDIDTVVVDSLKTLDPKRPIREADILQTAIRPD